jgi:hypothetical protein
LKDDHKVLLTLRSQLEVSILEKFEDELVPFLRNHLQNDHLRLVKQVDEGKTEQKLYTGQDKYHYMVSQNPVLKKLKEDLGLDFEF